MCVTLKNMLASVPGLDGYAYQADVWCVDCGQRIIRELWNARGCDINPPTQDDTSDSDQWPVPIFFGDSPDCAQHCCDCGDYLYGTEPEPRQVEDEPVSHCPHCGAADEMLTECHDCGYSYVD